MRAGTAVRTGIFTASPCPNLGTTMSPPLPPPPPVAPFPLIMGGWGSGVSSAIMLTEEVFDSPDRTRLCPSGRAPSGRAPSGRKSPLPLLLCFWWCLSLVEALEPTDSGLRTDVDALEDESSVPRP